MDPRSAPMQRVIHVKPFMFKFSSAIIDRRSKKKQFLMFFNANKYIRMYITRQYICFNIILKPRIFHKETRH